MPNPRRSLVAAEGGAYPSRGKMVRPGYDAPPSAKACSSRGRVPRTKPRRTTRPRHTGLVNALREAGEDS